jgi:hypothetical protein
MLALIVLAAMTSGCICNDMMRFANQTFGIQSFSGLSFEYNNYYYTLDKGQYAYYGYNFSKDENVVFRVKTDGSPVDFMVVNETNLEKYKRAVTGENVAWEAYITRTGVMGDRNITFTAPEDNTTYYYVIDNTGRFPGGTGFGHPIDIIGETKAGWAINSSPGGNINGMRLNVDTGAIGAGGSKTSKYTVGHYAYEVYKVNLTRGTVLPISLSADKPVDLLVIDRENITGYYDAVKNGGGRFNASMVVKSTTGGSYEFKAPYRDDFYVVIDNTVVPDGGAFADADVGFSLSGSYSNAALQY